VAAIAVFAICLTIVTVWFGRAEAWDRLLATDPADELRVAILPILFDLTWTYFPVGAGIGSFESVFRLNEPDVLLAPTYMNHAHNDWLEVALTGGIPAVILLLIALVAFVVRATPLFSRQLKPTPSLCLARLGSVLILLLAIASSSEYPLRTPSLACLFVVASLWMVSFPRKAGSDDAPSQAQAISDP
jgi:O-antigen ligase